MDDLPTATSGNRFEWALSTSPLTIHGRPYFFPYREIKYEHFASPQDGFGRMWHKTYRLSLVKNDVNALQLMQIWKTKFPEFWTKGNYFIGAEGEMQAGDVAVLNLAGPGGFRMISTGVLVVHSNDTAFTFITILGHMFAGVINFSTLEEGEHLIASINILVRASDLFFELGMRMGIITAIEDRFWSDALANLGAYFGQKSKVVISSELIDSKVQWNKFWNIRYNAVIRTTIYTLTRPLRWIALKNHNKNR
jgi:hypothetical protein